MSILTLSETVAISIVGAIGLVCVVATLLGHADAATLCLVLGNEHAGLDEAPNHVHGWEVILAANLIEANDSVDGHAIFEAYNRRQHLNLELLDEKGRLFGVNLDKQGFDVLSADLLKVHIDDLAPLKVLVEEGDHDVVSLRDRRQELLLNDLSISTVALGDLLSLLLIVSTCSGQSLLCHLTHHFLLLSVHCEVWILFLVVVLSRGALVRPIDREIDAFSLSSHLSLDHGSLVFNGLLHDHLSEQITCELCVRLHLSLDFSDLNSNCYKAHLDRLSYCDILPQRNALWINT